MAHDLVITGGMVVDGTGAEPRRADVAVTGGEISEIGSGLGGLTAANVMGRAGFRVLVLEQHFNFGGLATWFKRRGGHLFDISLHGFPIGMKKTCRKYWNAEIAGRIVELFHLRFDPARHDPDAAANLGRTIDVMIDGVSDESEYLLVGRHAGQSPEIDGVVHVGQDEEVGSLTTVLIEDALGPDLVAAGARPGEEGEG